MMENSIKLKGSQYSKTIHSMITTQKKLKKFQPVASRLERPTKKNIKMKTPKEITLECKGHSTTPKEKTKKYQPVASRLVRPIKKNIKKKNTNEITLDQIKENTTDKNTKKCQPAARDAPDLIQTECIPDRGLARPNKKINKKKNSNKMKFARFDSSTRNYRKNGKKKSKKVSACCQGCT